MVAQQAKGIFLPYPLLAILVTIGALALSGIIGLYVQVSSLSTTMLLRDADQRAANQLAADKLGTMQVYLQNDRERIVKLEAEKEIANRKR
jgi:hypothetical protein